MAEGEADLAEGVEMMTNGSVSEILFEVEGSDVKLGKNGVFMGTYVAPSAHIDVLEGATVVGALYGDKVQMNKESTIDGMPAVEAYIERYIIPVLSAVSGSGG